MPPSFVSFNIDSSSIPNLKTWLLMWKCSPGGGRKNENWAGEKKVQVLTLKWRLDSREWDPFHFYTSLKQKVTMLGTWFHFYESLKPKGKLCLRRSISFFNELDIEWELCSHASVSFFNELDIKWEICSKEWFHFYASLKPKGKLWLRGGFIF